MPCRVETYEDSPEHRGKLLRFLSSQYSTDANANNWNERLNHWWDHNPNAANCHHRGWVLVHQTQWVGFLGIVPAMYALDSKTVPALIATTWVVAQEHRNAALPMGIQLQRLSASYLLIDTTPSPEVQTMLLRLGWKGEKQMRRWLLPLGLGGRLWSLLRRKKWPVLKSGRRFSTDTQEVQSIAAPWQRSDRLEKWTTPEFLKWYAAAPTRKHQFLSVIDGKGRLTSCLWLTQRFSRGLNHWQLLEAFSVEADNEELESMVGALVQQTVSLPVKKARLLTLTAFSQDDRWCSSAGIPLPDANVCHFHMTPPEMKNVAKHSVLAEGDFGL